MVTMNRATSSWLSPAAIAKVTGGRVVRTGRPALRVVTDSRQVGPDTLFVALRGDRFDGHDFVPGVLRAGAAGVVVERPLEGRVLSGEGFVVRVPDCGRALIDLARSHRERRSARGAHPEPERKQAAGGYKIRPLWGRSRFGPPQSISYSFIFSHRFLREIPSIFAAFAR